MPSASGVRGAKERPVSKRETPMTERYWNGEGTLVLEFLAVRRSPTNGYRIIDGVILPDGESKKAHWRDVDIRGKDVICVQTKASRVGMYLLGQALFSRALLLRECGARSVRTVALCTKGDSVLEPIAAEYGVEVVVMDPPPPKDS